MIGIVCAFFHTEGKGFYSNAHKVLPDPGGNPCRCVLTVGES